jgi:Fur family transcriptional regulator, ferric uptake regulator
MLRRGMSDWPQHAHEALEGGGYRVSAPRAAVVSALDELGCSVTAQEISECLRERGEGVGVASIYRALQLLDDMRLVRRVDVGEPVARYEPVYPNGEHHHHLVCDRCGRTKAFEDPELESVIERLAGRVEYSVGAHDVTLRGTCPACRDSN